MLLLLWCITNSAIWSGTRTVHYIAGQMNRHTNTCRDTIVLGHHELKESNSIAWVEKDEIRYKGRMFDIKKTIQQNTHTLLVGHYDEKDDLLFKWLNTMFDDEDRDGQDNATHQWRPEAVLCLYEHIIASPTGLSATGKEHSIQFYSEEYNRSTFRPPITDAYFNTL